MGILNRCIQCGARIKWRERTAFGHSYKPVICRACADERGTQIFGSLAAYKKAMSDAYARELRGASPSRRESVP